NWSWSTASTWAGRWASARSSATACCAWWWAGSRRRRPGRPRPGRPRPPRRALARGGPERKRAPSAPALRLVLHARAGRAVVPGQAVAVDPGPPEAEAAGGQRERGHGEAPPQRGPGGR